MENHELIAADDLCLHYNIEQVFLQSLSEAGLIEMMIVEERKFIEASTLAQLEKFARMHYELNINIEGIEAINHLLQRIEQMQDELRILKNRLQSGI